MFPLLEKARDLWPKTRLPTSRCAQSGRPHSPKRASLGREQAVWSPPTLFTWINERLLNRNSFSSTAAEAMLLPMTHPILTGLEEKPWLTMRGCFPFCVSPCGTTQLEQCNSFKSFSSRALLLFSQRCRRPAKLGAWCLWRVLLRRQRGQLSKPAPAPTGIQCTIHMAFREQSSSDCHHPSDQHIFHTGCGRAPCVLCHLDRVLICCGPPHSQGQVVRVTDCAVHCAVPLLTDGRG